MHSFGIGASSHSSIRQSNIQGRAVPPETGSEQSGSAATLAPRYGVADLDFGVEAGDAAFPAHRTITGFRPSVELLPQVETAFSSLQRPTYWFLKRAFDIAFASIAILVSAPLMMIVAVAIKLSSPGPVFFSQERVGRHGRIFQMLKFRTMRVADKTLTDTLWSAGDDPRRTKIGALLRRTSLDELPQFFNVLFGEMSVVGPRPERPYFVDRFAMEIPEYEMRHSGHTGITGLAQIHGYRGDTCIQTRVAYDLEYLRDWSFALDLRIIFRTVTGVFRSAHE